MKAITFLTIMLAVIFAASAYLAAQEDEPQPLAAYRLGSEWHFIDYQGREMFPQRKLLEVAGYSEGLFRVRIAQDTIVKWAFMNLRGKIEFFVNYDMVLDFHDGRAVVTNYLDSTGMRTYNGFIDKKGRLVIGDDYKDVTSFHEGLAYVMNDSIRGYIDTNGTFQAGLKNLVGYPFFEGMAAIQNKDPLFGFIDTKFDVVIKPKYDEPAYFSEGLAAVTSEGKFGYIDKKGNLVINMKYDDAQEFKEGLAFVGASENYMTTAWGLINDKDSMLLKYQFRLAKPFSDGYACVRKDTTFGFIDKSGSFALEPVYFHADSFRDGLAWASVRSLGRQGFINKKGEFIVEIPKADYIIDLRWNRRVY